MIFTNEFQCFLILSLIMKLLLLWPVVTTWVAAFELSCDDYCILASSGEDVTYQPECNCADKLSESQQRFDDGGIYYEPANYFKLPTLFHEQPFYILNPLWPIRFKHSLLQNHGGKNKQAEDALSSPIFRRNIVSSASEKQEQNINTNTKTIKKSPNYLDLEVETNKNERSAFESVFDVHDLDATELFFLDCVDLQRLLQFRKCNKTYDFKNSNRFEELNQLSDEQLINEIDKKCSHISTIMKNSLNEIKSARPRKLVNKFEAHEQLNNNNIETRLFSSFNSSDEFTDSDEPKETIISLNTEILSDVVKMAELSGTITLPVPANNNSRVFNENITSEPNVNYTISMKTNSDITQSQNTNIIDAENAQTSHTPSPTTVMMISSSPLIDIVTASSNKMAQAYTESQHDNFESKVTSEIKTHDENQPRIIETKVPLIKIITHEFGNDSVQSFINGTEDIPNNDFPRESVSSTKLNNTTDFELPSSDNGHVTLDYESSGISGNLFFLYDRHQIPAKFFQLPSGKIHLGIDGVALCDKLIQNGSNNSTLLNILCNCYNSDNCTNK